MDEKELLESLALIKGAGINAQLCDTRVPLSDNAVRCGDPLAVGDESISDYVLLPKALVGCHPEIIIPAMGDSMTGVNIEQGDLLRVQLGVKYGDGDNVLAWIDGSCTVKTFFQDDDGIQWLVPQNESYEAIMLTGGYDVRILGRIVGIERPSPRVPFRDCQKIVRRSKSRQRLTSMLSPEQVDGVITAIGPEVKHARQWYAVYRAMADKGLADEGVTNIFCERVERLLPNHQHLPTARELQRMAVQSFAKPVAMWSAANAPVSGLRFSDYLRIARLTAQLIDEASDRLPF